MNITKNLYFIFSESNDPYENLALENAILDELCDGDKYLLVYKNTPCVVMGRFQNPWLECDLELMSRSGVKLVRRQSGGGTVYHDLGNYNFCFIQKNREHEREINNKILINALNKLDIPAYESPRSDLIVDFEGVRKFSGSAFKQKKDRSFHHGTLLVESNLKKLNKYLKPKHDNIVSKGTDSVRSVVINLSDINQNLSENILLAELKNEFSSYYKLECTTKTEAEFTIDETYLESLRSLKWRLGETPQFETEIDYNDIKLSMSVKKAVIKDITLNSNKIISLVDTHLYDDLFLGKSNNSRFYTNLEKADKELVDYIIKHFSLDLI